MKFLGSKALFLLTTLVLSSFLFSTATASAADVKKPAFDLKARTVKLNNGVDMPIIGLGTFTLPDREAEFATYTALKAGFRLIDTARAYRNEAAVGRGLKRAIDEGIVKREDVFITTKLWPGDYANAERALDESLKSMGLDYLDLILLHQPDRRNGGDVVAYKAMEKAVKDGKVRAIGLSNIYTPQDFDRVAKAVSIPPAILQNETHPFYQSKEMKPYIEENYGTTLMCWYPLGGRGNTQKLFENETIKKIAKAHDVSSAQVILRWHVQSGQIAIPGASNEDYIKEDYDLWDFELSDAEMAEMKALDKDEPFFRFRF